MSESQAIKDDVFMTASIELERLLTIVFNHYDKPEFREHAKLLPAIETEFKATLDKLKASKLSI